MKKRIVILILSFFTLVIAFLSFTALRNKSIDENSNQITQNNTEQINLEKNLENLVGYYFCKEDMEAFSELEENKLDYKVEKSYFDMHNNPNIQIERNGDSKNLTITISWNIYNYSPTSCKKKIWKMSAELDYEWYKNNSSSKIIRLCYNNGHCGIYRCEFPEGIYAQGDSREKEELVQEIYDNGEGYFEWDDNILKWSGDIDGSFKNYVFKRFEI